MNRMADLSNIDVIAPNFKKRHSGVTSTVVRLVPLQAKQIEITSCGPDLPRDVPNVPWPALLGMSRSGPSGPRVWHSRRNVEMVAGLALRTFGFKRLKLLFTSAAQRHHTGFTRWLIRQQDAVIATSAKSAAYLERDATVIRHGVDCDQFSPAADKAALRARLGLPTGTLIGCFGRIRHQKGNDVFVDAMCAALPGHPDAHGLIMGRATTDNRAYLNDLKAKVAAAGLSDQVHFRDEVSIEDLADHFRALDFYVAPQRWEGFGLTPLEAMACGAPVIATRVGAFEELVKDGETGVLVDIEDVDAMVRATKTLLAQPDTRALWEQNARQHVLDTFQLQQEADAIIAVYRSLLRT